MFEKIQKLYWSIIPHHWRPGQLWYRFKCFAWHRYTTVKPRYLPHTWYDRSGLMPHMMFEILSQFVEKECGEDGHVEWYGDHPHMIEVNGEQVNVRDELQDLYDWWHKDYFPNHDKVNDEWWEYKKAHSQDIWTQVTDQETLDWVESIEDETVDDLEEFDSVVYDSPEAEAGCDRLFEIAREREKHYREELEARLHRVIKVIPYMWT